LGRGPKETEQPKSRRDGIPFTFQPNVLFFRDQNALKKPFDMKRHLLGFFFEIVERRDTRVMAHSTPSFALQR
jgi:hypothetical protein